MRDYVPADRQCGFSFSSKLSVFKAPLIEADFLSRSTHTHTQCVIAKCSTLELCRMDECMWCGYHQCGYDRSLLLVLSQRTDESRTEKANGFCTHSVKG